MNELLRQHNAITEARYEMSALEKNIVYMLMRNIEEGDPDDKEYVIDIYELESVLGPLTKKEIREARDNLIQRAYTIKRDNGNVLVVSLMTVVQYDMGANKLAIKISSKILPYFLELKNNYTVFELNVALSLKSKYAKRLYEMLSQHKEAGVFNISIKDLKWRLDLLEEEKKQESYIKFNAFKQRVLEPAQKELTEFADITFSYEATKTGNKYTDLAFKINHTPPQALKEESFQSVIDFPLAARG